MPKKASPPTISTVALSQTNRVGSPSGSTSPDSNASPVSGTSTGNTAKRGTKRRRVSRPNVRRACSGCKKAHACCNPITNDNGDLTCKRCSKKNVQCDLQPDDIIVASSDVLNTVNPKMVENLSQTLERQSALIRQLMEQNQVLTNGLLAKASVPVQQPNLAPQHQLSGSPSVQSFNTPTNGLFHQMTPQEFHRQNAPNDFVRFFRSEVPVAMYILPDSHPFSFQFKCANDAFCKMVGTDCHEMIANRITMANQPLSPFNNDPSRQEFVSNFLQNILRQTVHLIQNTEFFIWSFDERHVTNNRIFRVYYTLEYGTLYIKYVEKDVWSNYLNMGPITMPETKSTRALLTEKELQSTMERFQQCAQQVSLWFLANNQENKQMYSGEEHAYGAQYANGGNAMVHPHQHAPSMIGAFTEHQMGNGAQNSMENASNLGEAPGFEFEWTD